VNQKNEKGIYLTYHPGEEIKVVRVLDRDINKNIQVRYGKCKDYNYYFQGRLFPLSARPTLEKVRKAHREMMNLLIIDDDAEISPDESYLLDEHDSAIYEDRRLRDARVKQLKEKRADIARQKLSDRTKEEILILTAESLKIAPEDINRDRYDLAYFSGEAYARVIHRGSCGPKMMKRQFGKRGLPKTYTDDEGIEEARERREYFKDKSKTHYWGFWRTYRNHDGKGYGA